MAFLSVNARASSSGVFWGFVAGITYFSLLAFRLLIGLVHPLTRLFG
ncbi:hypothetical protein VDG1235_2174 [Verrucomicrobiia bacterium DG1235]|nr:hypothetical protein VDG1235_2174 [Verrucomicrobiae bacterium DG1235]